MKTYAGIGSRQTPKDILDKMSEIASFLARKGFTLRSGGAEGADSAFEFGCDFEKGNKEIFLPWENFNNNTSKLYAQHQKAFTLAHELHPNWKNLKYSVQKLMARNVHQILGKDLDCPVDFVVCWTPNGSGSGGTGQALRLAKKHEIKVFDLGLKESIIELRKYVKNL